MAADRPRGRARSPKTASRTPLTYYRSAPASEGSPFEKKVVRRRRRKIFSKVLDFLIAAAVLFAVLYSLIIRPNPKLSLNSETYHPTSDYRQAATKAFKDFKNRNKLTLNEKAIVTNLQKQFPEIASASIDLPLLGQTPIVRLNIAAPSFILNSQGADFIVDSEGVAVAKRAELPQIKNLPTVIDQTGFNNQIGRQIISANEASFIAVVVAQSSRAKVPIASLTLPPLAQELDLRSSDRSYFVKFYLGGDALVQTGQFLAARHQFDQANNQPSQYLDVRVPGKIFYK